MQMYAPKTKEMSQNNCFTAGVLQTLTTCSLSLIYFLIISWVCGTLIIVIIIIITYGHELWVMTKKDPRYKRLKLAFSAGWQMASLEIG